MLSQDQSFEASYTYPSPTMPTNSQIALLTRYEQLEDLEEVITYCRDALTLCPPGHPDRSSSLHNLAIAVFTRYEQLGRMEDLEEVITYLREALTLSPPGHPDRSSSLNNLSIVVFTRYTQLCGIEDLEEAITYGREALALCPPGHPNRSSSLNNLAIAVPTHSSFTYGLVESEFWSAIQIIAIVSVVIGGLKYEWGEAKDNPGLQVILELWRDVQLWQLAVFVFALQFIHVGAYGESESITKVYTSSLTSYIKKFHPRSSAAGRCSSFKTESLRDGKFNDNFYINTTSTESVPDKKTIQSKCLRTSPHPYPFEPSSQCPLHPKSNVTTGSPVPTLLKSSILPDPKGIPTPIPITVPQAAFPIVTIIAPPIFLYSHTLTMKKQNLA